MSHATGGRQVSRQLQRSIPKEKKNETPPRVEDTSTGFFQRVWGVNDADSSLEKRTRLFMMQLTAEEEKEFFR